MINIPQATASLLAALAIGSTAITSSGLHLQSVIGSSTTPVSCAEQMTLLNTFDVNAAIASGAIDTAGIPFGGISGLDHVGHNRYLAISDDRSDKAPARAYELAIEQDHSGKVVEVDLIRTLTLTDQSGATYPAKSIDPESVRITDQGFFWTSEGDAEKGIAPAITLANWDGRAVKEFNLPEYHLPTQGRGVANNKAYEGLTSIPGSSNIGVLTEGPLAQDSLNRFTVYSAEGQPVAEFAYPLDPSDAGADERGATEVLATSANSFLTIERNWIKGEGTKAKIYEFNLSDADNVLGLEKLAPETNPVHKREVFEFTTDPLTPDNVEGLAWGASTDKSCRTLLVFSDDNFNTKQRSLVHSLTVPEVISP
ncbi:esterase-like activity of phytase family protein [Staphylococcus chromogenes]|nr:esterase-like activity of phytase family protein [Staphylococcus chromogenes]